MATQSTLEILIQARDEATAKLQSISETSKKLGVNFGLVGGAITGALGLAVKAAADAEVQMSKVDAILKVMGKTSVGTKDAIQKAADATLNLGFDNEEAALNITKLYQRTGNLTQATKLNTLAMDLARAKNIDLSTAGELVGQVLSGNGKVLKQYGIDIKETASPLEALGELQEKVAGQASAFSKTFSGQLSVLQGKFGEIVESIGGALLPILTHLLEQMQPVIDKVIEWINANPELVKQITIAVGILGLLLTALGGLAIILPGIITAFTIITGPIGIATAAILALVAATILIYKNWDKIKAYFKDVWDGIKIIFKESIDAIVGYFQPLFEMVNKISSKIGSIASSIGGKISGAASSVGNFLLGRANGGSVFGGQPYVVGERGPEVFVPRGSGSIIPNGAGAGAGSITVNINGGTYLSEDVAGQIGTMIIRQLQRVSRIGL